MFETLLLATLHEFRHAAVQPQEQKNCLETGFACDAGKRIDFADVRSTTLTLAQMVDLDNGGVFASAKFETRLTDSLELALTTYLVEPGRAKDALYSARSIGQVLMRLTWSF